MGPRCEGTCEARRGRAAGEAEGREECDGVHGCGARRRLAEEAVVVVVVVVAVVAVVAVVVEDEGECSD
jgi:hypothetical protein